MPNTNKTSNKVATTKTQETISKFLKDSSLVELHKTQRNTLAVAFPVQDIETVADANVLMLSAIALTGKINVICCGIARKVYNERLWVEGTYIDASGKKRKYTSFEQWAKDIFKKGKTTVFDIRKAGEFVANDGLSSILPHTTPDDFTYSHLVLFASHKNLGEWVKDKETKELKYIPILSEDGETSLLTELCRNERITPAMNVRDCKSVLDKLNAIEDEDGNELIIEDEDGESVNEDGESVNEDGESVSNADSVLKLSTTRKNFEIIAKALELLATKDEDEESEIRAVLSIINDRLINS